MKIAVVMDGRFEWADGTAYSSHMAYHPFVERFLLVFNNVLVCARAYDTPYPTGKAVTGPGAAFYRLGNYRGARSFIIQFPEVIRKLWRLAGSTDHALAYLPGTLPIIFGFMRLMRGRPLFCFVVADPADQLQRGALQHPLRRLVRTSFIWSLRYLLKRSAGAMYVTKTYLQQRYPAPRGSQFATSDVFISEEAIGSSRSSSSFKHTPTVLIYVAMMAQAYKAHDDLILALAAVRAAGLDITLKLVGDGPLRSHIEYLAQGAGVRDSVIFIGKVAHGPEMIAQLDSSDIFVMPSRAEGLPRAMIEAMARGLPVLSTNVGGVPELIEDGCMVPPNQADVFAAKILEFSSNPDMLSRLSHDNIETARDYVSYRVESRIKDFYTFIAKGGNRIS